MCINLMTLFESLGRSCPFTGARRAPGSSISDFGRVCPGGRGRPPLDVSSLFGSQTADFWQGGEVGSLRFNLTQKKGHRYPHGAASDRTPLPRSRGAWPRSEPCPEWPPPRWPLRRCGSRRRAWRRSAQDACRWFVDSSRGSEQCRDWLCLCSATTALRLPGW